MAQPPAQPISRFKLNSGQFPDLFTCPAIWAFLHQSITDFKKETRPKIPPNLNKGQIQALKSLQKRTDLVVKPSDQGGNIVIMTHTHYQTMCHTILDNHKWYRTISPTFVQTFPWLTEILWIFWFLNSCVRLLFMCCLRPIRMSMHPPGDQ